jgi:3-oxoacyl-[acyl-carrier-protein] synthase II
MNDGVVVTGMAAFSPFGRGLDALWAGLLAAQPAAHEVTRFNVDHWVYRNRKAATIEELPAEDGGVSETYARDFVRALGADLRANASIVEGDVPRHDVALILGSSQSGLTDRFQSYIQLRMGRRSDVVSDGTLEWMHSAPWLTVLSAELGVGGPAYMVSTACTSGTSSIGRAYELVKSGRAVRAYAGGLGYFSEISYSGFNILKLIGKTGCRPFDRTRDGLMLGDAFALVALERESFARERGAQILARIVGYGTGNEAYHATAPDPSGEVALRVMRAALGDEDNVARLDYINAHGTGTLANDSAELNAIRRLLEARPDPGAVSISSTKGHHGHALGAAGSIEFVVTVLAMRHGIVPPNVGLVEPTAEARGLDLVLGSPRKRPIGLALSNSLAFGGDVAAIAIEAVA